MKKFSLFLSFIGIFFCGPAIAKFIPQDVATSMAAQAENSAPKAKLPGNTSGTLTADERKQLIRLMLQAILERNQFGQRPAMSFADFMQRAQELEQKNSQAKHFQDQEDEAFHSAFYFKGRPQLMFQGTPDYAAELKDTKYIFISEASNHGQQSLVEHTISILETLRAANPGANILLANEFSVARDTYVWPIRFANVQNENIITYDEYSDLEKAADRLGIDILALDETSSFTDELGESYAKVGPQWVAFDKKDPRIQTFSKELGLDFNDSRQALAAFQYFLYSNDYGVELRNRQWGAYIKVLKDFYHIVVVYAGSAHLRFAGSKNSVPLMLNPKNAVVISLNSDEKLSAEEQQHYENREKLQEQFTPKAKDTAAIQTFNDGKGAENLSDIPERKLDFSKPHFRRYDGKVMNKWCEEHIRNQEALEVWQQQHKAYEDLVGKSPLYFPDWLTLDVYLH